MQNIMNKLVAMGTQGRDAQLIPGRELLSAQRQRQGVGKAQRLERLCYPESGKLCLVLRA